MTTLLAMRSRSAGSVKPISVTELSSTSRFHCKGMGGKDLQVRGLDADVVILPATQQQPVRQQRHGCNDEDPARTGIKSEECYANHHADAGQKQCWSAAAAS
jgi:hypothetical protein